MAARGSDQNLSLTPWVRFLLWDYDRGSWPYDILCVLLALILLLLPSGWPGDPFTGGGR